MSKVIAEYNDLKLIADAIRNRTGETADLSLGQMPSAIVGIETPDPVLQTKTVTPTTNVQNVTPDSGYDGLGKVTVNAIPSTYVEPSATKSATTYTPTTSNQTIASGTYLTGTQTIKGDANLKASNIAQGVSIFGITGTHSGGTDTTDATASADEIFSGETAYVNGSKVIGTFTIENELDTQDDLISQIQTALQNKASASEPVLQSKTVTPTTSQQYVTPDSNYDGLGKVTVNAIPSTYIQPSGTKTITTNGTYDVKSYASATVNVAGEDVTAETNTYTSELADLVTQISALETALEGKTAGGSGGTSVETCSVTITLCTGVLYRITATQCIDGKVLAYGINSPMLSPVTLENIICGSAISFYWNIRPAILGCSVSDGIEMIYNDYNEYCFSAPTSANAIGTIELRDDD